jgi:hypothetical protein
MKSSASTFGKLENLSMWIYATCIFILGFQVPNLHPSGMDESWNAVLAYGFEKGWHFGKDLIFTYGPWGWLENPEITRGTLLLKILWEILFNGLLAAAVITTAYSFSKTSRWFFLISSLFFIRVFPDTAVYLLAIILLSGWCLNQRLGSFLSYFTIIALAFLAEMKVTLGIMIVSGIGVIIITSILERNIRRVALCLAIFIISCAFFWKVAGQNWSDIFTFLLASKEISGGYQNAMGLTPESGAFMLGIVVVLLNVLTLLYGIWEQRIHVVRVGTVFILLIVYALVWKHSFIRADGHVLALFSIAPMLSIYGVELLKLPVWWRSTYILTIIFSGTAIFLLNPGMFSNPIDLIYQNLKSQIGGGLHSFNEAKGSGMGCNQKMQELHNALGDSSVDVISYEQGDVISAGLNYRCRPVPQSYSAYTPLLMQKNADFYKSQSAPNAVLFRLQTIDARVPMMDDSIALMELVKKYTYEGEVEGFALFKKKSGISSSQEKSMDDVFRKEVHLWEDIPIPNTSAPIWIKINSKLSWIGKIRSILFETPNLCISVKNAEGKEDHFRVVPEMAKTGFLLSPWITTTDEFVTFAQTGTGKTVQSIRIQPLRLGDDRLWKSLEIAFLKD